MIHWLRLMLISKSSPLFLQHKWRKQTTKTLTHLQKALTCLSCFVVDCQVKCCIPLYSWKCYFRAAFMAENLIAVAARVGVLIDMINSHPGEKKVLVYSSHRRTKSSVGLWCWVQYIMIFGIEPLLFVLFFYFFGSFQHFCDVDVNIGRLFMHRNISGHN